MKPIYHALISVVLYALHNVILEQKLSKYSTIILLIGFYSVMLPVAISHLYVLKSAGQSFLIPNNKTILLIASLALVYFVADYFFMSAYTNGGDILTITTIVIMFPIFASIIKFFWVGGVPNLYQVSGYVLAVISVILVTKGSS